MRLILTLQSPYPETRGVSLPLEAIENDCCELKMALQFADIEEATSVLGSPDAHVSCSQGAKVKVDAFDNGFMEVQSWLYLAVSHLPISSHFCSIEQ